MSAIEQKDNEKLCIQSVIDIGKKKRGITKKIIKILENEDFRRDKEGSPDLVKFIHPRKGESKGTIVGIEHFLVDHISEKNENNRITSLSSNNKKEIGGIFNKYSGKVRNSNTIPENAKTEVENQIFKNVDLIRSATHRDYIDSFQYSLEKHISKIDKYQHNLQNLSEGKHNTKLLFLIEIRSEFRNLFLNEANGVIYKKESILPVFEEIIKIIEEKVDPKKIDGIILYMRSSFSERTKDVIAFSTDEIRTQLNKQKIKIHEYAGMDYDGDKYSLLCQKISDYYMKLWAKSFYEQFLDNGKCDDEDKLFKLILKARQRALKFYQLHINFVTHPIVQLLLEYSISESNRNRIQYSSYENINEYLNFVRFSDEFERRYKICFDNECKIEDSWVSNILTNLNSCLFQST